MLELKEKFKEAAEAIRQTHSLIITAGAGMGVDSGLPDYRGEKGFWKEYPMYEHLGIDYYEAANPVHFEMDPSFGWGFYGHRIHLYRDTTPHEGFSLLQKWISKLDLEYFVVTSNVDGQFQKAGFPEEKVYEVHGSIHYLQCTKVCSSHIWENRETITVDHSTMKTEDILKCPHCGAVARPNVLMFGDFSWISSRSGNQEREFRRFLKDHRQDNMVVIEMGAGTAISTIRNMGEGIGRSHHAAVIRINPRDYRISSPHISFPCRSLEGLRGIDNYI